MSQLDLVILYTAKILFSSIAALLGIAISGYLFHTGVNRWFRFVNDSRAAYKYMHWKRSKEYDAYLKFVEENREFLES